MRCLDVNLGSRSYPILIARGLLSQPALIAAHLPNRRAVIVTNTTIAPLYLARLEAGLREVSIDTHAIIIDDGEAYKNWETLNRIFDELIAARAERTTTLIALGGGVIGDLTGFAAATYQRGVPFIQIPTTLLAQVDSSVGGKTGINHPRGKNMIGAFYQPRLVLADTDTLATLPARELHAGLAEVIKYGLIRDAAFFDWLEEAMPALLAGDAEVLSYAIERSCRNKADIVAEDETESGVRMLLNLGHTFGHAIEAGYGYGNWLHGEAVAGGIMIATELSRRLGWLDQHAVGRIHELLSRAELPITVPPLGVERYLDLMSADKKVADGRLRLILLEAIGRAFVTAEVPVSEIAAAIATCGGDG